MAQTKKLAEVDMVEYTDNTSLICEQDGKIRRISAGKVLGDTILSATSTNIVTGEKITISDSLEAPLAGLNIYGKSTQKTTTGANLINPNGIEIGGLAGPTGTPFIANDRIRTGSIPVTEGGRYFLSGYSPYTIANSHIFNGEGRRIAGFNNNDAIPSGGVSVRFSFYKGSSELTNEDVNTLKSTLMFNKGESALPYEPYTGGIPSPNVDYPQEIQTISDFVVKVKNSMGEVAAPQTLNITIPEQGFYGIPVSSGGNYTDTSGKQWICDEFDFKNKKFIKRVGRVSFDGSEDEQWAKGITSVGLTRFYAGPANGKMGLAECLCNRLIRRVANEVGSCFISDGVFFIYLEQSIDTVELLRDYLNTHPLDVIYLLETPVKYNLTDAEMQAFEELHTYKPNTTIMSDSEPQAGMKVEYALDMKTYVDNKFLELATQVLENA